MCLLYSFWVGLVNLKPKHTPDQSLESPHTLTMDAACITFTKYSSEVFAFTSCLPPKCTVSHLRPYKPHPAHCLLGLSSPCLPPLTNLLVSTHSIPQLWFRHHTHSPSQPWIMLPYYYSVIPPASSFVSGVAELACPLTASLSGPADWLTLTTDALGQWSLSSCGQESLENYVGLQAAVF